MEKNDDVEIEIDLVELLLFMTKRWYSFVLVTLLTAIVGICICQFYITPIYTSTTKIIILSRSNSENLTYSDMQLATQLTKDYEELIASRDVLEEVIRECSLDEEYSELRRRVTIERLEETRIISISVRDPSPTMAQKIANSVRETAAAHIRNVTDVEAVNVAESANLPKKPSSPSKRKWLIVSASVGFLLVLAVQMIRFLLDDTIKSSEDVDKHLGLPTLAVIPRMENTQHKSKGADSNRKSAKPSRTKKNSTKNKKKR